MQQSGESTHDVAKNIVLDPNFEKSFANKAIGTGVNAVFMLGTSAAGPVMGAVVGARMLGQGMEDEAREMLADRDDLTDAQKEALAMRANAAGNAIGVISALPFGAVIKGLRGGKPLLGGVVRMLGSTAAKQDAAKVVFGEAGQKMLPYLIKKAAVSGATGAATNTAQIVASNAAFKLTGIDPERGYFSGVPEGIVSGGLVGAVFGAAASHEGYNQSRNRWERVAGAFAHEYGEYPDVRNAANRYGQTRNPEDLAWLVRVINAHISAATPAETAGKLKRVLQTLGINEQATPMDWAKGIAEGQQSNNNNRTDYVQPAEPWYDNNQPASAQKGENSYATNNQSIASKSIKPDTQFSVQNSALDATARQRQPYGGGNPSGIGRIENGKYQAGGGSGARGVGARGLQAGTVDGNGAAEQNSRQGNNDGRLQPNESNSSLDQTAFPGGIRQGIGNVHDVVAKLINEYEPVVEAYGYEIDTEGKGDSSFGVTGDRRLKINPNKLASDLQWIQKWGHDPQAWIKSVMDEELRHIKFTERIRAAGYKNFDDFYAQVYLNLSKEQRAAIETLYPIEENASFRRRAVRLGSEWLRAKSQVENGVRLPESFDGPKGESDAKEFEDFIKSESNQPQDGRVRLNPGDVQSNVIEGRGGARFDERINALKLIASKRKLRSEEQAELESLQRMVASGAFVKRDTPTRRAMADVVRAVSQEAAKSPRVPYRAATRSEVRQEPRSPAWLDHKEGRVVVNYPAMVRERGLQRGSANKRAAMTFDEERTHWIDKASGEQRGHHYGDVQRRAWSEAPPEVKAAFCHVYGAGNNVERGAEIIRMLDQLSRHGEMTEATVPGKNLGPLRQALAQWRKPAWLRQHLGHIAQLNERAGLKA